MKHIVLMLFTIPQYLYGATATLPERIILATQFYQEQGNDNSLSREHERVMPVLQCIFDSLALDMVVLEMPWIRAKRELQSGNVEGIFLTSENNISLGVPTNPVYLEKWHAYTVKPPEELGRTLRLGVIRGSDEQQWLQSQGVSLFMEAVSYSQLVKQLSAERVQAFIADSKSFFLENLPTKGNDKLHSTFVRYAAKTLTFSKEYVASNPKILQQFNAAINQCNTDVTKLNKVERSKILDYVSTTVLPQFDDSMLENISRALSEKLVDKNDVLATDTLWREAFKSGARTPIAETILANTLSFELRRIKKNNPIIGEVMLTNTNGDLLGASDYTSDFWQGDEEKVSALKNMDVYLSDIKYDESTRKFIAHYSSRLQVKSDPEEAETEAYLIIGILLEDLLIETFLF